MKVFVKMLANYRAVLPLDAKHGIVELDVPGGSTVHDVISRYPIPLNDESVIVLNGLMTEMTAPLREGDTVTAFSAIAGG
jgi:molybdopterin converting factor small subunit